jgi:hypothetical protein
VKLNKTQFDPDIKYEFISDGHDKQEIHPTNFRVDAT